MEAMLQQEPVAPDARQIHVMVVDDEPDIIDEIVEFLSGQRIGVTTAGSAENAMGLFSLLPSGIVTVVLTDLTMPGGDGLSLARAIMNAAAPRAAPAIILMTGRCAGVPEGAVRDCGVFEVIAKPLRLSVLGELIRSAHAATMQRRRL